MKKLFVAACALIVSAAAWGGNKVTIDLTCLKGQTMINFAVDWSQLTIKGNSIDDWIAYRSAEQPENDALEELEKECKPQVKKLTEQVNKKLKKLSLTLVKKDDCAYTLCLRPLDIDPKGNNSLQCLVIDNATEAVIADFVVKGEGGHWGSMRNLWGDGFDHSGETLAGILAKAIKKPISYSWK